MIIRQTISLFVFCMVLIVPAYAQTYESCTSEDWISKSDEQFATDCAQMAFEGTLKDRQTLAWMFFARVNQLIEGDAGLSTSDRVPLWMAWPTDQDTFACNPSFDWSQRGRDDLTPVTEKKVLAGHVAEDEPDGANEEVTRNKVAFDYIKTAGLYSLVGVINYINGGNHVDMPVGSVELKGSWLRVPPGGAPDGALTFKFESGDYWWRGLHIMAKMRPSPKGTETFYSEEPSWFWTTFEYNDNPGAGHVRNTLITQRAPLQAGDIQNILEQAGIANFGFEHYAPNGTQIRFTVDGEGKQPVILGHTDMEDFAGSPNTAQPQNWRAFDASCHTCHATASINTKTGETFPFSVPTGTLHPQYYAQGNDKTNSYLGEGFEPLDFMWPIVFHMIKGGCK